MTDDISQVEIEDAIARMDSIAPSKAISGIDADPEAGAEALKLGADIGVNPKLVHDDLDGYKSQFKMSLTNQLLSQNPRLADYVRDNSLAEVVSNDDYGNLAKFSQTVPGKDWGEDSDISHPVVSALLGGAQGLYEGLTSPFPEEDVEAFEKAPTPLKVAYGGWDIGRRALSAISGAMFGAGEGFAAGVAREFGADEDKARREARGMMEDFLGRGGPGDRVYGPKAEVVREIEATGNLPETLIGKIDYIPYTESGRRALLLKMPGPKLGEDLTLPPMGRDNTVPQGYIPESESGRRVMELGPDIDTARHWIDAGVEPPRGLSPEIDKIKAEINSQVLDQLDANLSAAQESATRERSPELFQKFAEQHYGTATISISGDRVAELYRDQMPIADDGLLGWVPDIETKLAASVEVGEDVHIPLADWMTKVDPAVAKELRPDTRVWPGAVTEREASEPVEPKSVVDSALAKVRAASGTEPMFAFGDKKLELKHLPSGTGFEDFHEFEFTNEVGNKVGELTIIPDPEAKTLFVANINGLAGLYSNSFGPSLIRDLKRQIKAAYPDYEWITGHRVSGAREVAGTAFKDEFSFPKVKLALDDEGEFRQILDDKFVEWYTDQLSAVKVPTEVLTPFERDVDLAVREEIARIAGKEINVEGVTDIRYGLRGGIAGVYLPFENAPAKILVDLFSSDPVGYSRHEAIHHLRREGLFEPAEWDALVSAVDKEGWLDRYGIRDKYVEFGRAAQYEEAIAEAFRDWAKSKDEIAQPDTLVTRAFQKIQELYERIKARLAEIFGREVSFDELFQRAYEGEIGARQGEAGVLEPRFAIEETKAKLDNLRAEAAGLDLVSWRKLQTAIQKRFEEDLAASNKRALVQQKKILSKEWKENAAEIRKQVEKDIVNRPDVAADLLVANGELGGKQLDKRRFPLRASDLSDEQKSGLPRHYYSEEGLPIDSTASLLGYHSGDEMVSDLIAYNRDRGNMTSKEHLKKVVDYEVNRQMGAKYGDLQKNIILEAEDQALSENNLNVLLEEWQGAAMSAGVEAVDKDLVKAGAQKIFDGMRVDTVDSRRLMAQMLKHAQNSERLLIAGKPAEAVQFLQRRYELGLIAAEARKFEKEVVSFNRTSKQFAKREVKSVQAEYTNWIHDILRRIEKPIRRSRFDLQRAIEQEPQKNLPDFVSAKSSMLQEVAVWDQLYDENWSRNWETLSTKDFRAVHDSIKSLAHNGREELKIYKGEAAADFKEVKEGLIEAIAASKNYEAKPPRKRSKLATYYISHLQMENIFNRWDGFDAKGLWNQYGIRNLIDGANTVDALKKEYARKIKELPSPSELKKTVANITFKDPVHGTDIMMNRENLIAIMLNSGTESNLVKMSHGYGLDSDTMLDFIHQHARKEDWEFVQGVWDLFDEIKVKADTMYRGLSGGVAPESIPPRKMETPFGVYRGGYYPIIFHDIYEGKSRKLMGRDPLEQDNYFRATTPAGYTKSRTAYVAPLALNLDQMPVRMAQMLHDVGLREAVVNASKIFYDKDIREAIYKYYGVEYRDGMIPYLQAVANSANQMTESQRVMSVASEFIRQNTITTLIGLNPGTVMKHGPSALVTSMREVGSVEFMNAARSLWSISDHASESNWQFAIKNSLELQRRDRNWEETLYGSVGSLTPGDKFMPLRQKIIQWSAKPVALSDMISAVPTWLAAYEKEFGSSGIHDDAVYAADRAVRRAHGSTAVTSRTAIARDSNPWLTSVYNYFSDIMNRQMETIWKAGETLDMVKDKEWKLAAKSTPPLIASVFAYAIWPAIVEHLVQPAPSDEKESWAVKSAKGMAFTLGASWVGVRDFVSAFVFAKDPQAGLTGTAMRQIYDIARDFNKDKPLSKDHAGLTIQHGAQFVGALTGMLPAQVGRSGHYLHDVYRGLEHPKGTWEWLVGLRYGTTKNHSKTWEKYKKENLPWR